MQEAEIIERIMALCASRSWTVYRLSKESGITYSTLCTMLHKCNAPTIATLKRICDGLGITLSEFFDREKDAIFLTDLQKACLSKWDALSDDNRIAAEKYVDFLLSHQKETGQQSLDLNHNYDHN